MEILVLGPLAVRQGQDLVPLGPKLGRLLAILVAADGNVVSVDRLVDNVWGGEPPAKAERTLRTYVTRLRKTLDTGHGDEHIVYRDPGYVLEVPHNAVDARRFEDELDEAAQLLRSAEVPHASAVVRQCLARWRGEAFAGFADEEWCRPEAVRLERRRSEAAILRAECYVAAGDNERAVAEAEALVAVDPLNEAPRALLMRALHGAGRQAEALRVVPAYRSLMGEELGLEPSPELMELEGRIARREPTPGGEIDLRGYEVGERIGEGAFAVVHRGVQPGVERSVAIKIIRSELADRPDFIRRFEHEAQTIARLEHPYIVPVYDYWREPGAAYIVMRLLRGGSVEAVLRARGPYSREQVVKLLNEVGPALELAHRAGIVHRDIKPGNLLLDGEGHTYLSDFGIAARTKTVDGATIASPAYAAPEHLRGEPVDVRADVLSLGITVFELLTGRLPFAESTDNAELIRCQLESPIPPVSATRTDLPAAVDEVLARATAKASADRHATVGALVKDLEASLWQPQGSSVPASAAAWMAVDDPTNPYVGLHAFDEPDADHFHGRESIVAKVVDRVDSDRLVVVVGPSGCGKSSIVRAGLIPALRRDAIPGSESWFITTMVPGGDPFEALEAALLRVAVNPPASLREQLAEPGGVVRAVRRILPTDAAEILIVIDQFEELFTQSNPETTTRFLSELAGALARTDCPFRMVATLRADHYDAPLRHRAMADLVTHGTVTVPPMTGDEIERAIVSPANAVGVEVEPALAAELVAAAAGRDAALPLLQFALTEAFERRVSGVMTHSVYREMGGLVGALAARADRLVAGGTGDDEVTVRRLFGRLVTLGEGTQDTRRRVRRSELDGDERSAWVIDGFAKARLLTFDRDPGTREPTVEVAHEALLRDWPRLRAWLEEDRANLHSLRRVTVAARAWEASALDDGELARGLRLEAAAELVHRRPDLLNDLERAWVDASLAAQQAVAAEAAAATERDQQHNRRLRAALMGMGVLLVVALVGALVAVFQRSEAVESRLAAEDARDESQAARDEAGQARDDAVTAQAGAEIQRLMAESAARFTEDPSLALLLAVEANHRRDDDATRGSLQAALAREPRMVQVHQPALAGGFHTIFSSDGSVGVTLTVSPDASRLAIFDPVSGDPISTIDVSPGVFHATLSWDGSRLAVGQLDDTLAIFDTDSGDLLTDSVTFVGDVPASLALDGPGDRLLVTGITRATVFDVGSAEAVSTYQFDGGPGGTVANEQNTHPVLSADGAVAIIPMRVEAGPTQVTGGVDVVDVATGEQLAEHRDHDGVVRTIDLTEDGRLLATAGSDRKAYIRPVDGSEEPVVLQGPVGAIGIGLQLSGDGSQVLTASVDGTVQLWSDAGSPIGAAFEVGHDIDAVALGPPSAVLVSERLGGWTVFDSERVSLMDAAIEAPFAQVAPDGQHFLSPSPDFTGAEVRTLEDGSVVQRLDPRDGGPPVVFARWSGDGQSVLAITADRTALVRHLDQEEAIEVAVGPLYDEVFDDGRSEEGRFSPRLSDDGRLFFLLAGTSSAPESAAMWIDPATNQIVKGPLLLDPAEVSLVLRDGRVVIGGAGGPVSVLPADLASPPLVAPDTQNVLPLAEDPVNGLVAMGGGNGVGLLDPSTGEFRMLQGIAGRALGAAFSPSGDRLAVGLQPGGVQIISMESGQTIGVPVQRSGDNMDSPEMAWDDTDDAVWWAAASGPQRWITHPEGWIDLACEIAGRALTQTEWATFVSATEPRVDRCAAS